MKTTIKPTRAPRIVVIVLVIVGILFSFFLPINSLLNFYVDDGFFYLKTAKNFASGFGSTFDRVNLTNGYHPLWFIVLSLFFFITSLFVKNPGPDLLLRVCSLLHFTLICLSYFFIYKFFKLVNFKVTVNKIILFIALTLIPLAFRNYGLEVHVTTFLFAAFIWIKGREIILKENLIYSKIIIWSLLGLTRIDFFFSLIPALILFDSYSKDIKLFLKNIFKCSIPVFSVLIIYLSINYYYFDHILSISSTIKSTFPSFNIGNNVSRLIKLLPQKSDIMSPHIIIFILTMFLLFLKRKSGNVEITKLLFKITCSIMMFFLLNILFNIGLFMEWYWGGAVFLSALVVTILVKNRAWIINSVAAIFLLFSFIYLYNARLTSNKFLTVFQYSQELKRTVPENSEILQIDYSGIIGFLSDRKVVNGDGLINSFEYYDYYRSNRLFEYIEKYHIDYFSTYTARIDSSTNTVYETFVPDWGGYKFVFPTNRIKLRKTQLFDSFQFGSTHEWFLISLN